MKTLLTIVILFISQLSQACSPAVAFVPELMGRAIDIHAGYVIAVHLTGFELDRMKQDLFPEKELNFHPSPKKYIILVKETLKGTPIQNLSIDVSGCGDGFAQLKDRVLVFKTEHGYLIKMLNENLYKEITVNKANQAG